MQTEAPGVNETRGRGGSGWSASNEPAGGSGFEGGGGWSASNEPAGGSGFEGGRLERLQRAGGWQRTSRG